jgi:hypothetical protein
LYEKLLEKAKEMPILEEVGTEMQVMNNLDNVIP